MTFQHVFKNIPNDRITTIHDLLGTLHRLHDTALDQFTDNKRHIQFSRHVFRKTTLVHLQVRTYNDYRTCRVVNTLTQQVLTETSLFTFQTVGKRL